MTVRDMFTRIWKGYEAGELLVMCAWCGRIRVDGAWLAAPHTALAAIDGRNAVSHSICEGCLQTATPARALHQQPG